MLRTISQDLRELIDSICEDHRLSDFNIQKFQDVVSGFLGKEQDQVAFSLLTAIQKHASPQDKTFNDIWIKIEMGDIAISAINRAVFDFLLLAPLKLEEEQGGFQNLVEDFLASDRRAGDAKKIAAQINAHFHNIRKAMSDDYDRLRRLSALSNRLLNDIKTKTIDQCILDNWVIAKPDEPQKFWLFSEAALRILDNLDNPNVISLDTMIARQPAAEDPGARNKNGPALDDEFHHENPYNLMNQVPEVESLQLALKNLQQSLFKGPTKEQSYTLETTFPFAEQALSIPQTLARIIRLQPLQNKFIQAVRMRGGQEKILEIAENEGLVGYETLPAVADDLFKRLGDLPYACQFSFVSEGVEIEVDAARVQNFQDAFIRTKKAIKGPISDEKLLANLRDVSADVANLYSFIVTLKNALNHLPSENLEEQFRHDRQKFIDKYLNQGEE